jgi:hypothetical protein
VRPNVGTGTAVPTRVGHDGWMRRTVRPRSVARWPFALAAAIAYGMVASSFGVPLAHREASSGSVTEHGADCRDDAGSAPAHVGSVGIEPSGRDRGPAPDPFACCTMRLGTVGTPALTLDHVPRLEPEARRVRAPRPRMPSRPRPWRVSLGRHPPARSPGTTVAA